MKHLESNLKDQRIIGLKKKEEKDKTGLHLIKIVLNVILYIFFHSLKQNMPI